MKGHSMINHRRSGNSTVEFVLMISLLTGIGILILRLMTNQGMNPQDAISTGRDSSIKAIQND